MMTGVKAVFFLFLAACGGTVATGDDAAVTPDAAEDARAAIDAEADARADASGLGDAASLPVCGDAGCALGDVCCSMGAAFACEAVDADAREWSPTDAEACK